MGEFAIPGANMQAQDRGGQRFETPALVGLG